MTKHSHIAAAAKRHPLKADYCLRGHKRDPENLNKRGCKVCRIDQERKRRGSSPRIHMTLEERFWGKVEKTDSCWLWNGTRHPKGYGLFSEARRSIRAHRFSWFLHYGEKPPKDLFVCHSCDNPPCVNPAHLWLGTNADNMRDMVAKGRCHPRQMAMLGHLGDRA